MSFLGLLVHDPQLQDLGALLLQRCPTPGTQLCRWEQPGTAGDNQDLRPPANCKTPGELLGRQEQLQPGGRREREKINISTCANKSSQFLPPCCRAVIPVQPSRLVFGMRSRSPGSHVTASNAERLKRVQQSRCLL